VLLDQTHFGPAVARLAEAAAKISGQPPRFARDTIQHVTINQQFDCSLAREELGLVVTPVAETLRDAIQWFGDSGRIDSNDN